MKVIEFLRVSTQEQGSDDRAGLSRQKEANARTIEKHTLEVIKTIQLIDVSGTSVMRTPEIEELLMLIRRDDVKGVVVADHDILFRPDNFIDFSLLQHFIDTNTLIYTSDQVIDLRTQSGFIMAGIQAIMSGNELTQIKKRMQEAKEIKRRNGEHPNDENALPLGVSYDRVEKKFFYNDESDRVMNLFEQFYDRGIQNYRELEGSTGIHHRSIPNILKNEIYVGYRTYTEKRGPEKIIKKDGRQGDRKKVKRKPDEIIRVKVIDEPLIDEAIFDKIQAIISRKNSEYHKKRSKEGQRFLYSGFLRCGICGNIIYTTSGGINPKKDYYYCRSKSHQFKKNREEKVVCSSSYIPKSFIESSITALVTEKLTEDEYIKRLVERALDDTRLRDKENEAKRIREKISSIDKERSRCLDLYTRNDLFTKAELETKISKLNIEKTNLKQRLSDIEDSLRLSNKVSMMQRISEIAGALFEFPYWTPRQKREFLRSQIPELAVTGEGITSITLNFCKLCKPVDRDSLQPRA